MKEISTISRKYPSYRDIFLKGCGSWLAGKRLDDNSEGLWRIHDKLYDMTEFIERHPGGAEWLELTKGVDITEQFETHHITNKAENMLKKFYVRDAKLPRNYKITFNDDGFYRTLKRRVAAKLSDQFDNSLTSSSRFYCDLMLTSTIVSFTLAARDYNFITALIAAISLLMLTVICHNFLHQRDNWRMYLVNLNFQSFRDWRVFHAMSHHLYPNSYHDLECSLFEPVFNWMPVKKSIFWKYYSWVSTPIVYASIYVRSGLFRVIDIIVYGVKFHWDDLLPYMLPILMYTFGNVGILETVLRWIAIIFLSSFIHGIIAINGSHHHTKVFHDGDELKSLDFGIYQLAATFERVEFQNNSLLILITFGQHVGHHMFPTLDHGLLPQLNDIIYDTCKEFEADLIVYPWYKLFIGQFKQLTRTYVNKIQYSKG